ncbi:MAG TPA: radical SAM protein, partial [Saprospiraceae bacterium]|nr:radical SAM protein [Saprospiraceae bacterium]
MSGIYLHIPFCKKACHYCNFHFSTSLKLKHELIDALCREIGLRADYLGERTLSSIYFGGGTPSILDKTDLEHIWDALHKHFAWDKDIEITLEANPDDLNYNKVKMLRDMGINRLS